MYEILIFFNLIWGSFATIFSDGPCPKTTPVENLNLTALAQGRWLELARYPNNWENKEDCSFVQFKQNGGKMEFEIGGTYKGVFQPIDGVVDYAPNANGSGIIIFKSPSFEGQIDKDTMPVYILGIDYDKYIIGYECKYDEVTKKRREFAWIDYKTNYLDDKTKKEMYDLVKTKKVIYWDKLVWNHFSGNYCKRNS